MTHEEECAYDAHSFPKGGFREEALGPAARTENVSYQEEYDWEGQTPDEAPYPEGGLKAWSVVLGAWCSMIPAMGLLNTLGALHAWISTHQLSHYSQSSVGWIFGGYSFFLYVAGAQVGM